MRFGVRLHPFHLNAERAFEREQVRSLISSEERGSDAASAGASGAARTMDEIFRVLGQIVIDDLRDVLDVDAAGSEVGRDQDSMASLLKSEKSGISLGLRAIAMNHGGGESIAGQIVGQALGPALGAREDEAAAGFFCEQTVEQILLCDPRPLQMREDAHFPKA